MIQFSNRQFQRIIVLGVSIGGYENRAYILCTNPNFPVTRISREFEISKLQNRYVECVPQFDAGLHMHIVYYASKLALTVHIRQNRDHCLLQIA